jgi:hypothetical protein
MHSLARLAIPVVVLVSLASLPAAADDLAVGTWTGAVRNTPPRNPQPRPVSLIVKKSADPHWRWRGGAKELLGVVFRVQNAPSEVSAVTFGEGRLSYSFTPPEQDATVLCDLKRQIDGNYEGECKGADWGVRLITLSPPEPEPVKPTK